MFLLDNYFLKLCSILGWDFAKYQEDLTQALDSQIDVPPELVKPVLAIVPTIYSSSKFVNENNIPTRIEAPWITQGDTRYIIGTLLLVKKYTLEEDFDYLTYPIDYNEVIKELNQALEDNPFYNTAIRLGDILTKIENTTIYFRIGFFIPTNSQLDV